MRFQGVSKRQRKSQERSRNSPWVISGEGNGQPSVTGKSGGVTTNRVVEEETFSEGVVPCTDTGTEDVEVVLDRYVSVVQI